MNYFEKELEKRIRQPILRMSDGTPCETPAHWEARKTEIFEILQREIYGFTPQGKAEAEVTLTLEGAARACAGKVREQHWMLNAQTPFGQVSFPFVTLLPRMAEKPPIFLLLNFRSNIPDEYMPVEEITDNGFGICLIYYKDVVNDNLHGDYGDGMGRTFFQGRKREAQEWGKIGMWAYAASLVMDWLMTREDVDREHIAVIGHSRLAKTALWAGAQDPRFYLTIANNSCFGGASLARAPSDPLYGKQGERVEDFIRCGSWDWFCETFKNYAGREDARPFNQHFLLSLIAPRRLCLGGADLDTGGDTCMEYLAAKEASKVWALLGEDGLMGPDRFPKSGDHFYKGRIGYHCRAGEHYLSRTDWLRYMKFFRFHLDMESS